MGRPLAPSTRRLRNVVSALEAWLMVSLWDWFVEKARYALEILAVCSPYIVPIAYTQHQVGRNRESLSIKSAAQKPSLCSNQEHGTANPYHYFYSVKIKTLLTPNFMPCDPPLRPHCVSFGAACTNYSQCRSVFKKGCYGIACHQNLVPPPGFGRYAIAAFLKNASALQVYPSSLIFPRDVVLTGYLTSLRLGLTGKIILSDPPTLNPNPSA